MKIKIEFNNITLPPFSTSGDLFLSRIHISENPVQLYFPTSRGLTAGSSVLAQNPWTPRSSRGASAEMCIRLSDLAAGSRNLAISLDSADKPRNVGVKIFFILSHTPSRDLFLTLLHISENLVQLCFPTPRGFVRGIQKHCAKSLDLRRQSRGASAERGDQRDSDLFAGSCLFYKLIYPDNHAPHYR
ncbi:hypothetical protein SAMN02746073_1538 [Legionella jamestowniensis DSM 19215]|uniref:Uncharacterized protein n=1 Tax=Legionella jamestowniensis TaxID=455 RepID=A0A0W0UH77_9GAMM|nr:hypothetical protein Ljam_1295 [Legionella jamestowniensis]SFL70881.1 hypothetical protein SAMN02746073_1538 [Legionella jamestowniensis DSM 19215]